MWIEDFHCIEIISVRAFSMKITTCESMVLTAKLKMEKTIELNQIVMLRMVWATRFVIDEMQSRILDVCNVHQEFVWVSSASTLPNFPIDHIFDWNAKTKSNQVNSTQLNSVIRNPFRLDVHADKLTFAVKLEYIYVMNAPVPSLQLCCTDTTNSDCVSKKIKRYRWPSYLRKIITLVRTLIFREPPLVLPSHGTPMETMMLC